MFLSIIIPVYNIPENLLRECIESCLKQNISKSDYEIICVDDGSTNDNLSILREYENENQNIKVITQKNLGLSGARNSGMEIAQGDYLWFVDSDDFIAENSLQKLKKIAIEKNVDRLHLGGYHFIEFLSEAKLNEFKTGTLKTNYRVNTVFATRSLYRHSFLKENNLKFRCEVKTGEDQVFNFEIDQIKHTESEIGDVFYFYRIRENTLSHSSNKIEFANKFIKAHLTGCKIVKSYYDNAKVKKFKTIRFLHSDLSQIMVKISLLDFTQAKIYLNELLNSKLFPYKKWNSKGILLTLYTNLYSFFLATICRTSTFKMFFWILRCWSRFWTSKIKIKVEKN